MTYNAQFNFCFTSTVPSSLFRFFAPDDCSPFTKTALGILQNRTIKDLPASLRGWQCNRFFVFVNSFLRISSFLLSPFRPGPFYLSSLVHCCSRVRQKNFFAWKSEVRSFSGTCKLPCFPISSTMFLENFRGDVRLVACMSRLFGGDLLRVEGVESAGSRK